MITKHELKALIDQKKQFIWTHSLPWNETSLARLYDSVDAQIEGGSLIDIIKARPVLYDIEKETVVVEMVLDCSDLFQNEQPEHLGDGA